MFDKLLEYFGPVARVCEDGHPLEEGWKVCPVCTKGPKQTDPGTEKERIARIEEVLKELAVDLVSLNQETNLISKINKIWGEFKKKFQKEKGEKDEKE